jgi:hypothetical protein
MTANLGYFPFGHFLNQKTPFFVKIRIDTQGDVVMMSDGSEISSLDDLDVADLKERYEFVGSGIRQTG